MPIRSSSLNSAKWRKSSFTGGGGDAQCVELAYVQPGGAVRDSKANGPTVLVPTSAFRAFLTAAGTGRLDG